MQQYQEGMPGCCLTVTVWNTILLQAKQRKMTNIGSDNSSNVITQQHRRSSNNSGHFPELCNHEHTLTSTFYLAQVPKLNNGNSSDSSNYGNKITVAKERNYLNFQQIYVRWESQGRLGSDWTKHKTLFPRPTDIHFLMPDFRSTTICWNIFKVCTKTEVKVFTR